MQIRRRVPDAAQRRGIKRRPQEFTGVAARADVMQQQIGEQRGDMTARAADIWTVKDGLPALGLRGERPIPVPKRTGPRSEGFHKRG